MMKKMLFTCVALLLVVTQMIPAQAAAALTPTATATTYPDWVAFVADVSVPDGTVYAPGAAFTKTWRLKNIGTSTWTADYTLVFTSGEKMGATDPVKIGKSVAPGSTLDVSVNMTAPSAAGSYRGYWAMKNAAGKQFGLGATADKSFWVDIKVVTSGSATFDFAAKACEAKWISGAGALACPGTDGDAKGFILKVDKPTLENGATDARPGLVTFPQNTTNGYIQGKYPTYTVQKGDRFQSIINCAPIAKACDVFFRLDYQVGTDPIKTFWSFHEKFEGLYYRADVDLSALAGKQVNFILTVLSNGAPTDDRALWVAPVIAGGTVIGPTNTPGPSPTPKPTNTPGPSPTPVATVCDKVAFISDVTIPDGTAFDAGKTFTKTWRVKNAGTCTWTTDYKLVFVSGEAMAGATATNLAASVAPGATVDLSVNLTAPTTPGSYTGYWALKNAAGKVFGLGATANKPWWVQIKVNSGTYGAAYDFAANVCAATWSTGAGIQPCPGTGGDAKGYAYALNNPKYEDGTFANVAGILTVPQNVYNGYINGVFPAFKVQKGDKFESVINCDPSAKNCYVKFRLDYKVGDGALQTFWTFYEKYEGKYYRASIDLSPLAGKDVKFILTAHTAGAATEDIPVWIGPRIMRPGIGGTPVTPVVNPTGTPSPTATQQGAPAATATTAPSATPGAANWTQYQNSLYGFAFKYPVDGVIQDVMDNSARIVFTVPSGTNLREKYIDIVATDLSGTCKASLPGENPSTQNVTFNGVTFLEQTGRDQGAGQIHDWVAYSTTKGNTCVTLMYVLHSGNIDMYADPKPAQFDLSGEIATFKSIMNTYNWTTPMSVVFVSKGDVLNIRAAAGVNNAVVGTFSPDANNVFRTGLSATAGSDTWWEVNNPSGGTGWVNAYYLAEWIPPVTFCGDARVKTLLTNLGVAFKNSDGKTLASLASPKHGITFYLVSNNPPVTIPPNQVSTLFTSTTPINWGPAAASGMTVTGTFKDVMVAKVVEVVTAAGLQTTCNDLSKAGNVVSPWPAEFTTVNFYALYKPGSPGVDLDWRTFLVGIEFIGGQPYVVSMVNFDWVP